jgi:membrane-associated phospholipid phosphatase
MASRVDTKEIHPKFTNPLPLGRRFLYILIIIGIQMIYIPTSNRDMGGFEPRLLIDVFPIWPVWVVPYILCYPLWLFSFLWAIFKMGDRMFRSFVMAFIITCALSVCIFIAFPTYVKEATFAGNDLFSVLLRVIHENWGRYNAFPSGHIYITALLAFFYSRWYPRQRTMWIVILLIVSLSTLFTAQHYIVDIPGGLLVAWIGYAVGKKWMDTPVLLNTPAKKRLPLHPPS